MPEERRQDYHSISEIRSDLAELNAAVTKLTTAIIGRIDDPTNPGLLQRQKKTEDRLDTIEALQTEHRKNFITFVWTVVGGSILTVIAALSRLLGGGK